jgi:hypothetical protein
MMRVSSITKIPTVASPLGDREMLDVGRGDSKYLARIQALNILAI